MSIEGDRLYRLYVLPGWMVQPTAVLRVVVQPRQVLLAARPDSGDRVGGTASKAPLTLEGRAS
jgi:hypothetical protein